MGVCVVVWCWMGEWLGEWVFLTSALDGGEWSASRPGKDTGARLTGEWVGPTAGLDAAAKRKSPYPWGNQTPVVQVGIITTA
jgi:hypothetical protein